MLENSHPFAGAINGSLRTCAIELRTLEKNILQATDEPLHQEIVQMCADAAEFFPRLRSMLEDHVEQLESLIASCDEAPNPWAPDAPPASNPPPAPRPSLREPCGLLGDQGAKLHLAAIGYIMLHARSVALHDPNTAKLALTHLREIVPFAHSICDAAPRLAIQELSRHFGGLAPGAAETAVTNTREIWNQYALAGSVH